MAGLMLRFVDWLLDSLMGMILVVSGGILVFCAIVIFAIAQPLNEAACNQRADALHSQGVVDGDYKLLSTTCYLTLRNGRVIDADQFRAVTGTR